MPAIMKHIILANVNVKLYSWTLTFRKVVRQQIWGEVVVLIQASTTDPFWNSEMKVSFHFVSKRRHKIPSRALNIRRRKICVFRQMPPIISETVRDRPVTMHYL